jgi:hypothetical protein
MRGAKATGLNAAPFNYNEDGGGRGDRRQIRHQHGCKQELEEAMAKCACAADAAMTFPPGSSLEKQLK